MALEDLDSSDDGTVSRTFVIGNGVSYGTPDVSQSVASNGGGDRVPL